MLTYTCRSIEDFTMVITDKPNFPVLYTELSQAPALSSAGLPPRRVRSSVGVGRTAPSASHGDAPSWETQWDPSPLTSAGQKSST